MERQVQIFAMAGDPGGAAALVPVIGLLQDDPAVNVHLCAYYKAVNVFGRAGLACENLDTRISERGAAVLLIARGIDLLLTATSVNLHNLERVMICGAKKASVPALSVLDFWSNYSARFSKEGDDLACLPDRIAVMDDLAVEEMIAAGFPASILRITGQPAFDDLLRSSETHGFADQKAIRQKFTSSPEDLMITFVSQPISSLYDKAVIGYDEKSVFSHLLAALEKIAHQDECRIILVFIPHLRETEAWWLGLEMDKVSMYIASREDFRRVALSSDLVAGMTSSRLVEAAMMGCRTISLQIGAEKSCLFDIQRLGVSKTVTMSQEVAQEIRDTLFGEYPEPGMGLLYQEGNAAGKVVELAMGMIGENQKTGLEERV